MEIADKKHLKADYIRCYIGVGSNLDSRRANIDKAVENLKNVEGIEVKRLSSLYATEPVGRPEGQSKYLNGVIEIDTTLEPRELLFCLQKIEDHLGRIRTVKNGPRTIDLDILIFGDKKIDAPDLKIPHPRMWEREFVLKPLSSLCSLDSFDKS